MVMLDGVGDQAAQGGCCHFMRQAGIIEVADIVAAICSLNDEQPLDLCLFADLVGELTGDTSCDHLTGIFCSACLHQLSDTADKGILGCCTAQSKYKTIPKVQ